MGSEWTQCGASRRADGEAGREAGGAEDGEPKTRTQWLTVRKPPRAPRSVYMSPSTRDMQNVVMDGGWRVS